VQRREVIELIIDKNFLSDDWSIAGLIIAVKENFPSKSREIDTFWRGMQIGGSHFWAAG
jgi:hypothetical protein